MCEPRRAASGVPLSLPSSERNRLPPIEFFSSSSIHFPNVSSADHHCQKKVSLHGQMRFLERSTVEGSPPNQSPKRPPSKSAPIIVSDESDSETLHSSPRISTQRSAKVPIFLVPFRFSEVTKADLSCLSHGRMLNDSIMNGYLTHLFNTRNLQNDIGFTDTFFMDKLPRDGSEAAASWTGIGNDRLDLYKKFLIPVHAGVHWILLEINFGKTEIRIYDSLGKEGLKYAKYVQKFLRFQGIKQGFRVTFPDVPKQDNFYDCGVFVLEYAKFIFDGRPIEAHSFNQRDVTEFRKEIRKALANGESEDASEWSIGLW
jgi:Ulp1 family protease